MKYIFPDVELTISNVILEEPLGRLILFVILIHLPLSIDNGRIRNCLPQKLL